MEPVYCPNGHPNRPGTRLCAVCLALLEPSAPAAPPSKSAPREPLPPPPSVAPRRPSPPDRPIQPPPPDPAAAAPRRRVWPWLLLGCLLLPVLAIAALILLVLPQARDVALVPTPAITAEAVSVIIPTAAQPTAAATLAAPAGAAAELAGTLPSTESPTAVATITPLATLVGVVITPTFAFGPDDNFIQNGDFADDWINGWTREGGEVGAGTVEVRPLPDAPDDSALHLEASGPGILHLAQRVVLAFPVESVVFRARVRLAGTVGAAGQGRSALILRYEDADGAPLGASIWLDDAAETTTLWGTGPLPASGSPVVTRVLAGGWQAVELALGPELADGLSDVDPQSVRQITISMALLGEEACAPAACVATLDASQLSLTAELP